MDSIIRDKGISHLIFDHESPFVRAENSILVEGYI